MALRPWVIRLGIFALGDQGASEDPIPVLLNNNAGWTILRYRMIGSVSVLRNQFLGNPHVFCCRFAGKSVPPVNTVHILRPGEFSSWSRSFLERVPKTVQHPKNCLHRVHSTFPKDFLQASCRPYYNNHRPHSALGYLRPIDYYRGDPEARLRERRQKLAESLEARRVYWSTHGNGQGGEHRRSKNDLPSREGTEARQGRIDVPLS